MRKFLKLAAAPIVATVSCLAVVALLVWMSVGNAVSSSTGSLARNLEVLEQEASSTSSDDTTSTALALLPRRDVNALLLDLVFCEKAACQYRTGDDGHVATADLEADKNYLYAFDGKTGCAIGSRAVQTGNGLTIINACSVAIVLSGSLQAYKEHERLHPGIYRFIGKKPFRKRDGFDVSLPVLVQLQ